MEKIFLIIFITITAFSQSWVMKVNKSNGEEVTSPVQDIHKTTFSVTTGVREQQLMQNTLKIFALLQNYPDPFNPSTQVKYSIAQLSNVVIKVFDIFVKEIETLVNEEKPAGTYEVTWNAANLPSGVYFYRIHAGSFVNTKKMVVLK